MKNQKSDSSSSFKSVTLLDYGKSMLNSNENFNKTSLNTSHFSELLKKTPAAIGFLKFETLINLNSNCDLTNEFISEKIHLNYANRSLMKYLDQFAQGKPLNRFQDLFKTKKNTRLFLNKWQANNFDRTYIDIKYSKRTFQVALYPLFINNLKLAKEFWIVIHDVTENRNLISKIKNQEIHYRSILEQASSMLVRINNKEELLYLSEKLSILLGYSIEDFKKNLKSIYKLIHPEDLDSFTKLKKGRVQKVTKNISAEYRILNKNGEYQWFYQRQIPKIDKFGRVEYYDSIILDINEKKLLELNLLHSQRMEIVGQMASQVAHDFNNQLTTVLGQITLAMENINPNSQAYSRLLLAEKATLACGEMSKNLLSFGKHKEPKKSSINIVELLEDTINLAKNIIPSNIKFTQSINLNIDNIKGDQTEIQQVIMNLIVNSKDAIKSSGKINIKANKLIDPKQVSCNMLNFKKNIEYVEIQLSDTGCGIPEDKLPFIFDPYFSTKDSSHSGLGLSSVYSIIKSHDGFIDVKSKEDAGTTVTIYLPVCFEQNENNQVNEIRNTKARRLNILLADDEKMLLDMTKSALNSSKHNVIIAKNGKEAVELFEKNKNLIDLAILDYTMPFLNGREVIKQIKKMNPHLPIILSSGLNNFALKKTDNVEFLAKPYRISELEDTIYRLTA